ncbi:hypothetical protein [Variovorax boronicumulans]|uniref:hypothetical protein n=1 Tax=Variovorax boronicumulans TaxID=436515 RepID=UPI0032AF8581
MTKAGLADALRQASTTSECSEESRYAPVIAAAQRLLQANEEAGTIRPGLTTDDFFSGYCRHLANRFQRRMATTPDAPYGSRDGWTARRCARARFPSSMKPARRTDPAAARARLNARTNRVASGHPPPPFAAPRRIPCPTPALARPGRGDDLHAGRRRSLDMPFAQRGSEVSGIQQVRNGRLPDGAVYRSRQVIQISSGMLPFAFEAAEEHSESAERIQSTGRTT